MDSCWLIYTHEDKFPNRYKAISMWSADGTKQAFAVDIFDNFHGHRLLTGRHQPTGQIVLNGSDTSSKAGRQMQRFIYIKLDENHFKMLYETSKSDLNWHVSDSLTFVRTGPKL